MSSEQGSSMKYSLFLILALFSTSLLAEVKSLKVYAAASLTNVLQEIAKEYKGPKVVFNFDSSSKLAKEVESGAPADLFFSADTEWMDFLDGKDKIVKSSRIDLLSNKIVLIVPTDAKKIPTSPKDLSDSTYHHIALAAESVPAGKFARAALKAEEVLTDAFIKKIVNADNVRIALSWVAQHEASAGVVYATDVLIEPKVKIAFPFKEGTYPKIIYPAAVVKNSASQSAAKNFLEICKSKKAKAIFEKAGFINL
jgi:molybdate transport system substrate-binding protein